MDHFSWMNNLWWVFFQNRRCPRTYRAFGVDVWEEGYGFYWQGWVKNVDFECWILLSSGQKQIVTNEVMLKMVIKVADHISIELQDLKKARHNWMISSSVQLGILQPCHFEKKLVGSNFHSKLEENENKWVKEEKMNAAKLIRAFQLYNAQNLGWQCSQHFKELCTKGKKLIAIKTILKRAD